MLIPSLPSLFAEEEEPERETSPEFRSLMRDSSSTVGEPATFDCQVTGHPMPRVHWEKVKNK